MSKEQLRDFTVSETRGEDRMFVVEQNNSPVPSGQVTSSKIDRGKTSQGHTTLTRKTNRGNWSRR